MSTLSASLRSRARLASAIKDVRDHQEASGGWSQFGRIPPAAYATGMSLYALHVAGVPTTDEAYRKGVAFLLSTQYADGAWFVRSHSFAIQRYFESGFFRSQDFWDCFDRIQVAADEATEEDELEQAQSALLGCWKNRQMVSRGLLAYDTTNFYTWTASTNQRNRLAQRGHNKQGRHNLRQVGLSYGWRKWHQPLPSRLCRQRG